MSDQEKQQTSQVEEAVKAVEQPEAADLDGVAAANDPVKSTEKSETCEEPEAAELEAVAPAEDETASKEAETVDKSESDNGDKHTALDNEKKEVTEENGKTPEDTLSKDVGDKVEGDVHDDEPQSATVNEDEANGVHKRKVENGAEQVADEKSPKKAKVVDESEQTKVEETAA